MRFVPRWANSWFLIRWWVFWPAKAPVSLDTDLNALAPLTPAFTPSFNKSWSLNQRSSKEKLRLIFFSDGGTWLYSTLASEQVQHLHRFGFFWNPNPLLILCDCRWGQTKPSISSVPGQQTEPEQHLRPTLRLHQHVFWTTSQGEVLHARSKDVWGYSEMRYQTKNQFVLIICKH